MREMLPKTHNSRFNDVRHDMGGLEPMVHFEGGCGRPSSFFCGFNECAPVIITNQRTSLLLKKRNLTFDIF